MAVTPRILATSGGTVPSRRYILTPGELFHEALRLSGKQRPRVLLLMTATGDDTQRLALWYAALGSLSVDASHLALFPMPNAPVAEQIDRADVIWVGGGSVVNLLAVWREHHVDDHLRHAWEQGTILAGVSAGSICWHVGGTTDSFGPDLQPVTNGLGLLPYGNGVHYDTEEQRRPLLQSLVADQTLPLTYATDDHVGILYEGTEPVRVLADMPVDPLTGPAAYRLEHQAGTCIETRLTLGAITS